jgi:amino acid adenylation domain-containing protein
MTNVTNTLDSRFIPEMVSYWASVAPTRTALGDDRNTLDYATLNSRSNQIAAYLLSRGVKPEDKIGVSIRRSVNFVVAALGILKSGAGYVALDPSYPEARQRLIAQDAGLLLSFSEQAIDDALGSAVEIVSLASLEIQSQLTSDPAVTINPDHLAYVIYTSGSTGVPKGVEVTHANLRHLVQWHNAAFKVTSDDRATLLANVGFDAAVWEIWPYLSAGAALFVPESDIIRQPEELRDYILQNKIDVMFAPTLLAEALLQLPWPEKAALRTMLTGGDTLRIAPKPGLPFLLVNNYGPAECTVVSTSGELAQSDRGPGIPSIGRAIAGAQVYLLDEKLQEVPAGSQGEICIGGAGVARGYLNQPELTAERFVLLSEGRRIYRSGDLGSINPDGSIQFLGRIDQQVKIRGYRIECGEIESALNGLPSVQTSAVIVCDHAGHRSLTAYVVPEAGATLSHEDLRQDLRSHLPEYMVPEQFVRLEQLPLSDNGKIDRRNLPAPNEANIIASTDLPQGPIEAGLMSILTELLEVDHIARHDDFFMLGGHSFIAAQLIARIQDRFDVKLGLRAVFEHPTLVEMAEQIEQKMTVSAD